MRRLYYIENTVRTNTILSSYPEERVIERIKEQYPDVKFIYRETTSKEYDAMDGEQYVLLWERDKLD